MTESIESADAAQQPGAVDETMPDPAAAAGESTADSQGEPAASAAAPAAEALAAELRAAPRSPDLGNGTEISVDLDAQAAVPPTTPPAALIPVR